MGMAEGKAPEPDTVSRHTQKPPAPAPATISEAAAFVRSYAVKLYDRQDGEGVDKRKIADTLFRAAFEVLDTLPDDQRHALARKVHEGSYSRTVDAGEDKGREAIEPSAPGAASQRLPAPRLKPHQ